MAQDTWTPRDLLVLDWLVEQFDRDWETRLSAENIAAGMGWDVTRVKQALMALYSKTPPLIVPDDELLISDAPPYDVMAVTADARTATRAWPDAMAEQFVAALRDAIERTDDPAERSKLQRLLDAAGSVSSAVLGGVLTTAATTGLGLG